MTDIQAADAADTPYLLVDERKLTANLAAMAHRCAALGIALRPHAKTHKCAEIAERQLAAGATGLTVATVGEAEAFADSGVTDLFIAYPLWPTPGRVDRIARLAQRVSLRLGTDSAVAASRLAGALPDPAAVDLLVEIDSGHHRSGVAPKAAGTVAAAAVSAGTRVIGVFTFPGHGYGPGPAREAAARQELDALAAAADSLRHAGITPTVISCGSTPTAAFTTAFGEVGTATVGTRAVATGTSAEFGALTELRPGVYAFGDAQQVELGSCTFDEVALSAVATVVSVADDRVVLDAGSKILGADRPAWASGFGRLPEYPHLRITSLSEHHAVVDCPSESTRPELGDRVRMIPNHVCSAVNLVDELLVDGAAGRERWPVIARGHNA